jgi:UDP:flavonoid glycosyltransferase YjiC (YdhE family)
MINDATMQDKLKATSAHMQAQNGPQKAAGILDELVKTGKYSG